MKIEGIGIFWRFDLFVDTSEQFMAYYIEFSFRKFLIRLLVFKVDWGAEWIYLWQNCPSRPRLKPDKPLKGLFDTPLTAWPCAPPLFLENVQSLTKFPCFNAVTCHKKPSKAFAEFWVSIRGWRSVVGENLFLFLTYFDFNFVPFPFVKQELNHALNNPRTRSKKEKPQYKNSKSKQVSSCLNSCNYETGVTNLLEKFVVENMWPCSGYI